MARQAKTQNIIDQAYEILAAYNPMTLRQAYYQLVSRQVIKKALTMDDIRRYSLPPNFTKATDTRSAGHIAKHGDVSVELDALPPSVLQDRLREDVEGYMDMAAFNACQEQERIDRKLIVEKLEEIS